jgi:hypothetical protein
MIALTLPACAALNTMASLEGGVIVLETAAAEAIEVLPPFLFCSYHRIVMH